MANTKGSDNPFPSLLFAEHVDPANPPADFQRLFVDTDHLLKLRDSSGTVTTFGTGLSDPMTTRGDLIYRNSSNSTTRLGRGSASQVLTSDGTDIAWAAPSGLTRSTLGTTSAGASFSTTRQLYLKKITLASAGLLTSIHAFVKGDGATLLNLCAVLFNDSSGPLNLLAITHPVWAASTSDLATFKINTTVRDVSMAIGRWLTSGDYWIGVNTVATAANLSLAYNSGSGTDATGDTNNVATDSSINTYTTGTNDYCIYADIVR